MSDILNLLYFAKETLVSLISHKYAGNDTVPISIASEIGIGG
jgi:hypothetical protein